ncbi:SBBP repeat-containing protein [Sorangium cellulosum]|uniref:SBBP repeat-containing protein n=1 Tax=Sorangium cellulosum TaxID=56 RepID=UPI001F2DA445|nr:SBBP repeat-containing protein [Sorangium cellulosum]
MTASVPAPALLHMRRLSGARKVMRARAQSHVLVSLLGLGLCGSGCALLLGLDEFADRPPDGAGAGGTGGAGGAGGSEGTTPTCTPDASEACYAGPPATRNEGACREGTRTCGADGTWGVCEGEVVPAVERCDAEEDENCDELACIVWAATYEQTGDIHPIGIASDAEGDVFVSAAFYGTITVGNKTFSSADTTDILLLKLSASGDVLWGTKFGDSSADNPWGMAVGPNGNTVLAGQTSSGATDFGDGPIPSGAFVAQLDTQGKHAWSHGMGGGSNGKITAVAIDANDDVIAVGTFNRPIDFGGGPIPPEDGSDIIVAKLDSETGLATAPGCWTRQLGGTGSQGASAVAVDRSNNIFLAGSSSGALDFGGVVKIENSSFVMKLTPSGVTAWVATMGDPASVQAAGITVDAAGRPVVVGYFRDELKVGPHTLTAAGSNDTFIVQFEPDGTVGWVRTFGGDDEQWAGGVALDPAGNILVAGYATSQIDFGDGPFMLNDTQGFLAKLTPDAELVWSRVLGGGVNLEAVATSPEGETLVAGRTKAVDADFGTGPLPWTSDGTLQHLVIAKLGR